jgi:hypothetical protein
MSKLRMLFVREVDACHEPREEPAHEP